MNDLSRQKRRPSLALMEHLMPFMLWWLSKRILGLGGRLQGDRVERVCY